MLWRTSTPHAPWTIVESNSKWYARVKVLKTVVGGLEKRLK
jgi:polyphosphate kinase 2 (PPK2 family)